MTQFQLKYQPFGESAILIKWPSEIDLKIIHEIRAFAEQIKVTAINSVLEINYVYNTLLVVYDTNLIDFDSLKEKLISLRKSLIIKKNKPKTWKIPVCYSDEFALDLEFLSDKLQLSKKEIISIHSKTNYAVYGIGFLPGFLYLGGLDEKLHYKRRSNPRLKIPEGSVAIGGSQTGIYPQESPGGWHIIGKIPFKLFDVTKNPPMFINPGDFVKLIRISKKKFEEFASKNKDVFKTIGHD